MNPLPLDYEACALPLCPKDLYLISDVLEQGFPGLPERPRRVAVAGSLCHVLLLVKLQQGLGQDVPKRITYYTPWGQHVTMVSMLASRPSCPGSIPSFPQKFADIKIVDVVEVNRWRCLEDSVQ